MEGISNEYIEEVISDIVDSIGIKDYVNHEELESLVWSNRTKECIEIIARYLGIPIKVNLSYVSNYVPGRHNESNANNFDSKQIVKTDWTGRGTESITAQVSIPTYLPLYGTRELDGFPINVRISRNCTYNASTFIAVMAHELSHIVLQSIWHKEKNNEVYADITAMVLGFSKIIEEGRKVTRTTHNFYETETQTTTYGYLSDSQFRFSFITIKSILDRHKKKKQKLVIKAEKLNRLIKENMKNINCFKKCIGYIDKKIPKKITPEDGFEISKFHQLEYTDNYERAMKKSKESLTEFNNFIKNLNHYHKKSINKIDFYEKEADNLIKKTEIENNKLLSGINILKKYIPFPLKIAISWKIW